MSFHVFTAYDPGAPSLLPANGSLCTVLDWALQQAGWSIHRSSTFARIYRSPNGRYLYVDHNSAVSSDVRMATVRGCEGGELNALLNPFPTITQRPNNQSTWQVGLSTSQTPRDYRVVVKDDFFLFMANTSTSLPATAQTWALHLFGEVPTPFDPTYACVLYARQAVASSTSDLSGAQTITSLGTVNASSTVFWQRNVDGSVLSSQGSVNASGATLGAVSGTPSARGGYQNRIYRESVFLNDMGTAAGSPGVLGLLKRGAIPQLWNGLHSGNGGLGHEDTFQDTAYDPAAVFRAYGATTGSSWFIVEETDTWRPY